MALIEVKKLRSDVDNLKRDMKQVKDLLDLSAIVDPLTWKDLSDLDRLILKALLAAGHAGMETPALAQACGLPYRGKERAKGRHAIWQQLRKIRKISYRLKGDYIVLLESRRWRMNWEDFTFAGYSKPPDQGAQ